MLELAQNLQESALELVAAGGVWGYVAVFVLAAIPWFEVIVVVPVAVGVGYNPWLVGVVAFAGNMLPVIGIARLERKFRFPAPDRLRSYAERIWDSHGVPGVAAAAPWIGIYVTTSVALALDAPRRELVAWTAASIAFWTAVAASVTYYGVELLFG